MVKEACYAPPADIWSLCAILFHLLSGQPLINLDLEKTSSAEFYRMAMGCAGHERDLLDDAADKAHPRPSPAHLPPPPATSRLLPPSPAISSHLSALQP